MKKSGGKMGENIQMRIKIQNVFETSLFRDTVKEYFENVFMKIFERYSTTPAKGGTKFEEYSDMSYPMHVLNGILPAMLYLEQKLLENNVTAKSIENEDNDIKKLVQWFLLGITFHDINKLVGKSDLKESLEDFKTILNEINLKLNDEDRDVIKYLICSAEDKTKYSLDDNKLPTRRNLNRLIKDYLDVVHLADSISIPPEESLSHTFILLQKKLQNYFSEVHTFYFHETPYEVLSRYLLIKFINRIEGKILLISPRGFVWVGKRPNTDDIESDLQDIEIEYQNLLLDELDNFLTCNWQKAQLDIFRYITPNKEFVKEKLVPFLLERKKELILYHGLPSDETKREEIRKEIEKLENDGKLEVVLVFKLILTLTPNNNNMKKLKKEEEKKYYPEVKDISSPVLRNVRKVIEATHKFDGDMDILYDDLVELLIENYKDEAINIKKVLESVLSYAYLDGIPVFKIKVYDIGDKQNICSICGAETSIVAKEGVAFGFAPRGFTNRTVVSIKNTERKICETCLAEVMLRKLIFSRSKDLYAVYIDACDYTTPILNAEKLAEKIEEQINDLRALSIDIFNSYKIIYGYPFRTSKNVMVPFLMAHLQTSKDADFLRRFYELLVFASNTGFKVYLTYALNPDRIKKETFVLDYAPKSIKTLGWDRIRIDKLQHVRDEFEILMNLAKAVGGRRWQNEFIRVLNDYSASPLAFFYYLYRLDNPLSFTNKNQDKIQLVYKRIGGEIMGVIEKLADKASEIEWSGYTASKQTWIIRTAIDALKTGVQRKLDKEDTIALMAGVINKKVKFPKKDAIDDFCRTIYEELYEKTWQSKIPSKTELRYWTYAFASEYDKKSDEKRKKMNKKMKEEKQKEGGEKNE